MSKEKPEATEAAEKKTGAQAVAVYDKYGNFVREYSAEIHGEHFIKLAEQFASNPEHERFGYTVKKSR